MVFLRIKEQLIKHPVRFIVAVWLIGILSILLFQGDALYRVNQYQGARTSDIIYNEQIVAKLQVVFPEELSLQDDNEEGRLLQILLTPTVVISSSSLLTVTLTPRDNRLIFTDQDGFSSLPIATFNAKHLQTQTASWFVHRAPNVDRESLSKFTSIPFEVTLENIEPLTISDTGLIQISLETRWGAFRRKFFELCFSSTLVPLIALGITVITWTLKWIDEQRERKLDELSELWEKDPVVAAERFVIFYNSHDKDSVKQVYLDKGWKKHIEQGLKLAIIDGKYQLASDLCKMDFIEDQNGLKKICEILKGSSSSEDPKEIKCLLVMASDRQNLIPMEYRGKFVQTLIKTLEKEGGVDALNKQLPKPSARTLFWLFKQHKVNDCLKNLLKPEHEFIQHYLNKTSYEFHSPPLWSQILRPPSAVEELSISTALKKLNWLKNPFINQKAEEENLSQWETSELFIPEMKRILNASSHTILFSAAGIGQTFALRYLLFKQWQQWQNRENPDAIKYSAYLPVLLNSALLLNSYRQEDYIREISFALGKTLLHTITLNPELFERSSSGTQKAIARLIIDCEYRLGDLQQYINQQLNLHHSPSLHSKEASESVSLKDLETEAFELTTMLFASVSGMPITLHNIAEIFFLLKDLCLADTQGFLIAIDIPQSNQNRPVYLLKKLQPLFSLMPDLADHGVFLKIGLPIALRDLLSSIPGNVGYYCLTTWNEDALTKLLQHRLMIALDTKDPDFESLFDSREISYLPSKWSIEHANSNPQRLLRLGNALLKRYGEKEDGHALNEEDLNMILRTTV